MAYTNKRLDGHDFRVGRLSNMKVKMWLWNEKVETWLPNEKVGTQGP
jgi:hypothetical protein